MGWATDGTKPLNSKCTFWDCRITKLPAPAAGAVTTRRLWSPAVIRKSLTFQLRNFHRHTRMCESQSLLGLFGLLPANLSHTFQCLKVKYLKTVPPPPDLDFIIPRVLSFLATHLSLREHDTVTAQVFTQGRCITYPATCSFAQYGRL